MGSSVDSMSKRLENARSFWGRLVDCCRLLPSRQNERKKHTKKNLTLSKIRVMFHCCKGHRDCWNHFTYITGQTAHQYQQVGPFGLKSLKAHVLMRAFQRLLSNHLSASPNGNHKADKEVRCFLQRWHCQQTIVQTGTRRGCRSLKKQILTWFLLRRCFSWHMRRAGCLVRS